MKHTSSSMGEPLYICHRCHAPVQVDELVVVEAINDNKYFCSRDCFLEWKGAFTELT